MNVELRAFVALLWCFLLATNSSAAIIVGWDFAGLSGYGVSPYSPSTSLSSVTIGGLARGAGIGTGGSAAANGWGGTDATASSFSSAIQSNDFLSFSITPNANQSISLNSIDAHNIRRSGTGPTSGLWQYQIGNGGFLNLGSAFALGSNTTAAGNAQSSINLSGIADLQNVGAGTAIDFRLVLWGGTATVGTFYLNDPSNSAGSDFTVSGQVSAVPEPSSILLILAAGGGVAIRRMAKQKERLETSRT